MTTPNERPYRVEHSGFDTEFIVKSADGKLVIGYFFKAHEASAIAKALNSAHAAGREEVIDALEALHAVQNGPPLLKYEADWNEAMKKAEAILVPRWEAAAESALTPKEPKP